jgi:hypothetical protein
VQLEQRTARATCGSAPDVLKMNLYGFILIATVVALTGCSDHFEPDLTRCKAQAVEVYGSVPLSKAEARAYVRECMRVQGWPIKDACLEKREMWDSAECYLR